MQKCRFVKLRCLLFALTSAVLLLPVSVALAQVDFDFGEEEEDEFTKPAFLMFAITGFGGAHTFGMEDVNFALKDVNTEIGQQGTQGISYDDLNSGLSFGGGARLVVGGRFLVQGEFERYSGNSSVGGSTANAEVAADFSGWVISAGYDLAPDKNLRIGFGVGLGFYTSDMTQTFLEQDPEGDDIQFGEISFDADDSSFHTFLFVERKVTPRLHLTSLIGYRSFTVDEFDIQGFDEIQPATTDSGRIIDVPIVESVDSSLRLRANGAEIDWSGLMARIGVTIYFNPPSDF